MQYVWKCFTDPNYVQWCIAFDSRETAALLVALLLVWHNFIMKVSIWYSSNHLLPALLCKLKHASITCRSRFGSGSGTYPKSYMYGIVLENKNKNQIFFTLIHSSAGLVSLHCFMSR